MLHSNRTGNHAAIGYFEIVSWAVLLVAHSTCQAQSASDPSKAKSHPPNRPLLSELFEGLDVQDKSRPETLRPETLRLDSAPENKRQEPARAQHVGGEDMVGTGRLTPRVEVARRMRSVQEVLNQRDVSTKTQMAQQEIINALESMLENAKDSRSQFSPAPSRNLEDSKTDPNSQTSAQTSALQVDTRPRRRDSGQLDAATLKSLVNSVWGHLPARTRDQMQTPTTEQFLPKYERVIADYYRRLAAEDSSR